MLTSCLLRFQKDFVHLLQASGVLVVLSQAWIEELYFQVLEQNLLGEAGYWGSPENQAIPLITVVTGKRTTHSATWVQLMVRPLRTLLLGSARFGRPGQQRARRSADQPISTQL